MRLTVRDRIWRNLMVIAINHGIKINAFTLSPAGDDDVHQGEYTFEHDDGLFFDVSVAHDSQTITAQNLIFEVLVRVEDHEIFAQGAMLRTGTFRLNLSAPNRYSLQPGRIRLGNFGAHKKNLTPVPRAVMLKLVGLRAKPDGYTDDLLRSEK